MKGEIKMFETFDGFGRIVIWYLVSTFLVLFLAFLNVHFKWVKIDMKFLEKMSGGKIILWVVIIAPIAEETISRILPALIIRLLDMVESEPALSEWNYWKSLRVI